jgi:large subunit ribosomal protein L25
MKRIKLEARLREPGGKGAARRLRSEERIPAVLYGQGLDESLHISLSHFDITHSIRPHEAHNFIIDLEVNEKSHPTIIVDLQQDPITEEYYHVDFYRISMDKPIHTKIPILLEGTAQGVKEGGVVEQTLREVEISCLPLEMPDAISISIEHLEIGDAIHVSDLEYPDSVTLLTDESETVVNVRKPRVLAALLEEEAAEDEEGLEEGEEGAEGEETADDAEE